ncbi:MAG: FecR domain-containing protein [Bacteroidota bacterium]
MNDTNPSIESLIASESFQRYCFKSSQGDMEYWEKWKIENPDKIDLLLEAEKWVMATASLVEAKETQEELKKLQQKLTITSESRVRPMFGLWSKIAVAAAIVVLAVSGFFMMNINLSGMEELSTTFGEVKLVNLPDGSILTLNGHSKARYASSWEETEIRELWLDGEGFFDVKSDSTQPFIVHTPYGDIKVLGTRFNALTRAKVLKVTLLEGAVELTTKDEETVELKPGEQLSLSDGKLSQQTVDMEPVTAWKNNMMIFRDASIESIIEKLKWDFNWEIEVRDESILDRRVNAFIQENNPELLLQALAEIYDLSFEKKGEGKYLIK